MTINDCWHGAHSIARPFEPPVQARPGYFTCADHADLELRCRRVVAELREVGDRINAYAARPTHLRHPDAAKQQVEGAVRDFLRELPAVQVGPGIRSRDAQRDEELDLTITCREEDPSSLGHESYCEADGIPLRVHAELKHRVAGTSWSTLRVEIDDGLDKVDRSIANAAAARGHRTWTALVLTGTGWRPHTMSVLAHLAARMSRPWQRVDADPPWWPFVDAVLMPGMALKKHDVHATADLHARPWPILAVWPSSERDPAAETRPLALARGFIAHHLRAVRGEGPVIGQAWSEYDAPVITGPCPRYREMPQSDEWHGAIGGVVLDPAMPDLASHSGDAEGSRWARLMRGVTTERHLLTLPENLVHPRRRSGVLYATGR